MFYSFPGSKPFIRRKTQPLLNAMASRHYRQCRDFLEKQAPDLVHVMTPDASAMVMIRAGHDAGIPVIYQELGIPFHPPGFSYYREFTSVLPLCSEVAALSPSLFADCREKLRVAVSEQTSDPMLDPMSIRTPSRSYSADA